MIAKVRADDLFEYTLIISLVELLDPFREQTKGAAYVNTFRIHSLELLCRIYHTSAGTDHIIYDDDIFAVDIITEKLMGNDGILPLMTLV